MGRRYPDSVELRRIREEYKAYWFKLYPHYSSSTAISDSYYLWNNPQVGVDFWWSYISNDNLKVARDKVLAYLQAEKNPNTAQSRTTRYYNNMLDFKSFLDRYYPGLAARQSKEK